jgi:hypothetical protein
MKVLAVVCVWIGVLFLIFGIGSSAMAFIGFFATIGAGLCATAALLSDAESNSKGPSGPDSEKEPPENKSGS